MLKSGFADNSGMLQAVLDCVPEPVLVIGEGLRIVFANRAAVSLCGIDLIGQLFVAALRHPAGLDCVTQAMAGHERVVSRITLSENGADAVYRLTAERMENRGQADKTPLIVTLRDDSHLDGVEQMQRNFVANVSHELRSPLAALASCTETLRNMPEKDTKARASFLDIMTQETGRMERLVSDLLSLSRVEAKARVRPTDKVNIPNILKSSALALKSVAEGMNSDIIISCEDENLYAIGDHDHLNQVFINLIENALKYGREGGGVTLNCYRQRQSGENSTLAIVEVTDEGLGIDAVHLPRLTERFYRVDEHRSRRVGGTGLGLAIVKHILQRHQGELSIASQVGKGSVFTVSLPEFPNDTAHV